MLRTTKYGETSIIAQIYTELFGIQSYLLNGIRTSTKKGNNKAIFFQPTAQLDLEAYHNELKHLNRIKEFQFSHIYKHIFTDVLKNGVASYMVELLSKCLKQPESDAALFAFIEDCFIGLDECNDKEMTHFPLFFSVQLTHFFGLSPRAVSADVWDSPDMVFDIEEGVFTSTPTKHHLYLEKKYAFTLSKLMQARRPRDLTEIMTDAATRRLLLDAMDAYYSKHISDFGKMKTLPVLTAIMR